MKVSKDRLKDPSQIVLEYLRVGGEVMLKGSQVSMIDAEGNVKALVTKGTRYILGKEEEKEEMFFDFPITVTDFVNECDKMNGDDLFLMAANTVLKKQALGEYKK